MEIKVSLNFSVLNTIPPLSLSLSLINFETSYTDNKWQKIVSHFNFVNKYLGLFDNGGPELQWKLQAN